MSGEQREYLVHIRIDTGNLPVSTVADLRLAEAKRAKELAAQGHIVALWRVPEEWANRGLWRATSMDELNILLDSLPLRPYMTIHVDTLLEHPSDPRRTLAAPRRGFHLPELPELTLRRRGSQTVHRPRQPLILDPLPDMELVGRTNKTSEPRISPQESSSVSVSVWKDLQFRSQGAAATAERQNVYDVVKDVVNSLVDQFAPDLQGGLPQVISLGLYGVDGATVTATDRVVVTVGAVVPVVVGVRTDDGTSAMKHRDQLRLTVSLPAGADHIEVAAALLNGLHSILTQRLECLL